MTTLLFEKPIISTLSILRTEAPFIIWYALGQDPYKLV